MLYQTLVDLATAYPFHAAVLGAALAATLGRWLVL